MRAGSGPIQGAGERGRRSFAQTLSLRSLLRGRLIRFLLATVIGALTGAAVFSVSQITGRNLFIITGAVAGAATVATLQVYGRAARLTEVKVSVPQFSELTFVVNNDARQVAWQLFVETVTRISTQPLLSDEGLVREAMTSLYGLFSTTRETLKASRPSVPTPGSQTVEHLAVSMLNRELRPFLSKWHPRLREFEQASPQSAETDWPEQAACRQDLSDVQQRVYTYALGFARLAGVQDADRMISQVRST